jgi:DNA polymerase-3 subunit gamma/tau
VAEDAHVDQAAPAPASRASIASPPAQAAGGLGADQPYQALYRRYRPQRFADVKGQEPITRALRNAVREGRVAHAYLFSGPRGTGKTSTARILAMALNCQGPVEGEPDGTCESCTAIRTGASMDVFELDAASNRGIDEMRELRSRVALGTPGRWKVYIIDEVHQLTGPAASALLKTLEEPPSHVVFVLATTDPQKVPGTILSRTQHFEFRLLDGDLLTDLLTGINEDARLALPPEIVRLAVQRGRGSARDAESALEQLAASGGDDGEAGLVAELAEALAERDVGQTLQAVAKAVNAGREPRRLGNDLLEHLRNAFLAIQAPSLVILPGAAMSRLTENAREMGLPLLVRAMETVGEALVDIRDSVDPRVTLEVALIRLVSPAVDASPGAILERLERLERAQADKAGPSHLPQRSMETAFGGTASGPVGSPGAKATAAAAEEAPAEQPGPPAAGPAQAKVALGAYLRSSGAASEGSPAPAVPTSRLAPAAVLPARPDAQEPGPGTLVLPSRDELTKAWGDTVLVQLSQPAKVYLAPGRFVEVTGAAAVFGLPEGLLARASNFKGEAETALAAHFGRPVPLRLVPDRHPSASARPGGTDPTPGPGPDPEDMYDLDEIVAAPSLPAVPPEEKLLEAFPRSTLMDD